MRLGAVRLHDGDLDEKKREEREDGGLHEADEDLEGHERHRADERNEIGHDENEYFPCKDVTEKAERERNDARELGEKFDDADDELDGAVRHIDELTRVLSRRRSQRCR